MFREAASMLMLLSVDILAQHKRRERFAIFLWIFALWDLGYFSCATAYPQTEQVCFPPELVAQAIELSVFPRIEITPTNLLSLMMAELARHLLDFLLVMLGD